MLLKSFALGSLGKEKAPVSRGSKNFLFYGMVFRCKFTNSGKEKASEEAVI